MLSNEQLEGRDATISGWGLTEQGTPSRYLMVATNRIVKTDEAISGHAVSKERMLQMSQEGGRGNCLGDSGGIGLLFSHVYFRGIIFLNHIF